jgi:hypothetical protein
MIAEFRSNRPAQGMVTPARTLPSPTWVVSMAVSGKQKFCSDIHNNMEFDGALAGVLAGVAYKTENPLAAGGSAVLGISAGVEYGIDKTACR